MSNFSSKSTILIDFGLKIFNLTLWFPDSREPQRNEMERNIAKFKSKGTRIICFAKFVFQT